MLAVCSNCQKEFVNIIMRENGFDNQLIMFKLHHMEQICGVLRYIQFVTFFHAKYILYTRKFYYEHFTPAY